MTNFKLYQVVCRTNSFEFVLAEFSNLLAAEVAAKRFGGVVVTKELALALAHMSEV